MKLLRNKINKWISREVGRNLVGNEKGSWRKRTEDEGSGGKYDKKALHTCEVVKELSMLKQQQQRITEVEESK